MKFLIDNHIANRITNALVAEGHDVVRAAIEYPTWADEDLLALAVREQRVIVTEDSDFSELIYAFGMAPPLAIIYIRAEPEHQPLVAERVLETLTSGRLDGSMAVVRANSTRYRSLSGRRPSNDWE